ncbi:hypothetical protein SUNI508_07927 [Seiridium unicorne]|uniref:Ankyrin repeat protein n=1 Tax=Seiridium unicorne TaxID=138068 RepID=A0ABR2UVG0_9PEZI
MSTKKAGTKLDTLPTDVLRQIQASFVFVSDMIRFRNSISKKIHNALNVGDLLIAAAKSDFLRHETAMKYGIYSDPLEGLIERDRFGDVAPDLLSLAVKRCRDLGVVQKAIDCYRANCLPAITGNWYASLRSHAPLRSHGQLALLNAVQYGRLEVVKMLLDAGSDIDADNVKQRPPHGYAIDALRLATSRRFEQIALCLIERGAIVGPGHLELAASLGSCSLLKVMLDKFEPSQELTRGEILRETLDVACHYRSSGAVHDGNTEVLDILFDSGLDLTGTWHSKVIRNAAMATCLTNAVYLHLFFSKHKVPGLPPIWSAVTQSLLRGADHVLQGIKFLYPQHMELLFDQEHETADAIGSALLWYALNIGGCVHGRPYPACDSWRTCDRACTYLIEKGCKLEHRHLQAAAFHGYTEMIDQCVAQGFSINTRRRLPEDIYPLGLYSLRELTPLEHAVTYAWTNPSALRGVCRLVFHGAKIDGISESVFREIREIYSGKKHPTSNVYGKPLKDALKKARSDGIRPDRSRVTGQGEKDDLLNQFLVVMMIILKV